MTHVESGSKWTLETFEKARQAKACIHCGKLGVVSKVCSNNGGLQIVCSNCDSGSPWGGGYFIKQQNGNRRQAYPKSASVEKVWMKCKGHCIGCNKSREWLQARGIGLQRHHVPPYETDGHSGAILPVCTNCHQILTGLQKMVESVGV
jgi:hypothetical protein